MPTLAIGLSVLALVAGTWLASLASHSPRGSAALSGWSRGVVAVLILGHILPVLLRQGDAAMVALVLVGAGAPLITSELSNRSGAATLVVGALSLHALLDGAALGIVHGGSDAIPMSVAVVAHRLPLALFLFGWLSGVWGKRGPWWAGVCLALATVAGGWAGTHLAGFERASDLVLAGVAGMLLHVLFHSRENADQQRLEKVCLVLGLGLGMLIMGVLPHAS